MDIDNDDMFEHILMEELEDTMEDISDTILREVKKNIQEIVYDPYEDDIVSYKRWGETGGFIGSWIKTPLHEHLAVSYEIWSNPERMHVGFPSHESKNGGDRRSIMTESIIRGINWDFSYKNKQKGRRAWWKYPRNFWKPTIDVLKDSFFDNSVAQGIYRRTGWYIGISAE